MRFSRKQSLLVLVPAIGIFFTLYSPAAQARPERVDSADRLALINQATGADSNTSPGSFESRVNAMLDTTPSTQRALVSQEDANARQQQAMIDAKENAAEIDRVKELNPGRYDPAKNRDNFRVSDSAISESSKINNTEKSFQKDRTDIQKEFDDRLARNSAAAEKAQDNKAAGSGSDSSLPPSLSNNPFYKGEAASSEDASYEKLKPVLVSRLVTNGVAEETASDYVSRASNKEDLILLLMRESGQTYGEANNSVG